MHNKTKYIIIAVEVGVIAILLLVLKWQHDLSAKQEAIQSSLVEMKQLGEGIVRSQAQLVSKHDLEEFSKSINLEKIEHDLALLHAVLDGTQVVIAQTPGSHRSNLPSTSTEPNGNAKSTCPYLDSAQVLALVEPNDNDSIPFGSTKFSAWKDKPWELEVYPRDYSIVTVIGQDESGRHYTYNKFFITVNKKDYIVPIKSSSFKEVLPESSFHFSPRLYFSGDVGVHLDSVKPEVAPSLGVALFSRGKTTIDPDWSLVNVGMGYNSQSHSVSAVLAPVSYNLGHHLPLVNNLHIGPAVSLDSLGSFSATLGVRVGL